MSRIFAGHAAPLGPNSPQSAFHNRRFRTLASLLIFSISISISSISLATRSEAANSLNVGLEQCGNSPTTCDSSHDANWQTGNLNDASSNYVEGDSVPYRMTFDGLTDGVTYKVTISWDSAFSGKHAIDYITSYNRTETTSEPCAGGVCAGAPATVAIPSDPTLPFTQIAGSFSLWGATFASSAATIGNSGDLCGVDPCNIGGNPSSYQFTGSFESDRKTLIDVYFTADSTSAVLAWGGHIASAVDWGVGNSAGLINGSPYHMAFSNLDCSDEACNVGEMDRSMNASAVIVPAAITIVKNANVKSSKSFSFSASPSPLTAFSLVDDGSIDSPDATPNSKTFGGITNFTNYSITENQPSLWTLTGVECSVINPNKGKQTPISQGIEITLTEGEYVTCEFANTRDPIPGLTLEKSADLETYSEIGDIVTYTYLLTNSGQTTLGPGQFTITDNKIDGGAAFNCGPSNVTLLIGQTLTCTHAYSVVADDIDAKTLTNVAVGHIGSVDSNSDSVTLDGETTNSSTTTSTSTTSTSTPSTTSSAPTSTIKPLEVTTTTNPARRIVVETTPEQTLPPTADPPATRPPGNILLPQSIPYTGANTNLYVAILVGLLIVGSLLFNLSANRTRHQNRQ